MRDGECLVFVEVRFRGRTAFGHAAGSVDLGKQRRLARAAEAFLARETGFQHSPVRFDVLAINTKPDGALSIDWIRDAFRPE